MTALKKTINYISRNVDKQRDRWEAGLSNSYSEWQDVLEKFGRMDVIEKHSQELLSVYLDRINKLENIIKKYGLQNELWGIQ